MTERPPAATILHADLDAFYASVEQRDDPALRGRPVIVGGGVVLASSYEARARGVRTAMGGAQARRLCPEAIVVAPRFSAYVAASRAVAEIFRRSAPLVEAISIDEAFLDVRGLDHISGTPLQIAQRLRREVRDEVDLAITVGVASTKFLAKVASGVAKPDGLLLVRAGAEHAFLAPLPVTRLWGVGRVTAAKLQAEGIRTVADVARLPEIALVDLLGRGSGRLVHALAHNRDPRAVRATARRRSIGAQRALGRRGSRLGAAELRAELIARRGLTLVGVALTNLCAADAVQLALPLDRAAGLDAAVDALRDRFGSGAIQRAVHVGRPERDVFPLPPGAEGG